MISGSKDFVLCVVETAHQAEESQTGVTALHPAVTKPDHKAVLSSLLFSTRLDSVVELETHFSRMFYARRLLSLHIYMGFRVTIML